MTQREHHEYQGGPWTAVAQGPFLALVEPDASWRLVDGLWQVARDGGDVLAALNVVAADGFTALPRFAVVRTDADGAVHAVLRGPVRLRLHGADGAQEVAAGDGAVWTEHRAVGVHGLELVADDVPEATWWPLVGGVVRAGGLRTGRTGEAVTETEPRTATHEQPVVPAAAGPDPAVDVDHVADVDQVADVEHVADIRPTVQVDAAVDVTVAQDATAAAGPTTQAHAQVPAVDEAQQVTPPVSQLDEVADEPVPAVEVVPVDVEPQAATAVPDVTPDLPATSAPDDVWFAGAEPQGSSAPDGPAVPDVPSAPARATDAPLAADQESADPLSDGPGAVPASWSGTPAEPEAAPEIPWWPLTSSAEPAATSEPGPADAPAPATPAPVAVETSEPDVPSDDHDGMTILSSDLARLRDRLPAWSQDAVPGPFPTPGPEPLPARMVLSTGLVVALDRPVLLGRAPQVARVTNRELPRLVTVPSPNQDISRTHAEVRVEGEHVVVTDLDSTNGVHVSRPGEGVRRLHPGEPSVVGTDEVVDLGDGVTFTVERSST